MRSATSSRCAPGRRAVFFLLGGGSSPTLKQQPATVRVSSDRYAGEASAAYSTTDGQRAQLPASDTNVRAVVLRSSPVGRRAGAGATTSTPHPRALSFSPDVILMPHRCRRLSAAQHSQRSALRPPRQVAVLCRTGTAEELQRPREPPQTKEKPPPKSKKKRGRKGEGSMMAVACQSWPRPPTSRRAAASAELFFVVVRELESGEAVRPTPSTIERPGDWLGLVNFHRVTEPAADRGVSRALDLGTTQRDSPPKRAFDDGTGPPSGRCFANPRARHGNARLLPLIRRPSVAALLDRGGISIYDPQRLWLWSGRVAGRRVHPG